MSDQRPEETNGTSPEPDPKARFREALQRKQHRAANPAAGGAGPKATPHSAPAKPQRTFRRKSG